MHAYIWSLHYQSFCDHSRNFAWVIGFVRNVSGNCLSVKSVPQKFVTNP
jgi:hypothetical protein